MLLSYTAFRAVTDRKMESAGRKFARWLVYKAPPGYVLLQWDGLRADTRLLIMRAMQRARWNIETLRTAWERAEDLAETARTPAKCYEHTERAFRASWACAYVRVVGDACLNMGDKPPLSAEPPEAISSI